MLLFLHQHLINARYFITSYHKFQDVVAKVDKRSVNAINKAVFLNQAFMESIVST
jgi:hypothetical protein